MFPQYRFRPPPPNPVFGIQSPPTFTYTKPSEIYPPGLPIIGPKGSQHRLAYASYRSGNLMESDGVKARRTDPLYAGYPYLGGYGNGEISLDAILSRIPDIAEKIIKSENFEKMPTTTSTPWVDVLGVKSKGLIKSEPANVLNSMPGKKRLFLNQLYPYLTISLTKDVSNRIFGLFFLCTLSQNALSLLISRFF